MIDLTLFHYNKDFFFLIQHPLQKENDFKQSVIKGVFEHYIRYEQNCSTSGACLDNCHGEEENLKSLFDMIFGNIAVISPTHLYIALKLHFT